REIEDGGGEKERTIMGNKRLKIAVMATLFLLGALGLAQTAWAQGPGQPGPPSGRGVQPVWVSGNPTCAELAAQFAPGATWNELRLENGSLGPGTYPDTWGQPGDLVVTIDTYDGTYFSWSSKVSVDAAFVKAGANGNLYQYDPTGFKSEMEATSDTSLHAPINPNTSRPYEVSHISFCYDSSGNKGTGEDKRTGKPNPVILKQVEPTEALPGEEVTFTLEATNQGQESAWGVVVTDEVSEHLEILDVTTTQGTVTIEGQKVTVDIAVIGPGFVVEIVIRARVREDAPASLELENVAVLTSPNGGYRTSQTVTVSVPIPMLPVTGGLLPLWPAYVLLGLLLTPVLLSGALTAAGAAISQRGRAQ
ncbi:MAG: isopeptide-forming domain-containing fimbrial protein, partial [Anaerolineae bacterium]